MLNKFKSWVFIASAEFILFIYFLHNFGDYLSTLVGQFNTNYIIFRDVEIFKNYFFQSKK
jgi:hypothetical protein